MAFLDGELDDLPLETQQLLEMTHILREKYGDQFIDYCGVYAQKIQKLADYNQQILSPETISTDKEQYVKTVEKVVEATKDFYDYVGSLPPDIRKFVMLMADNNRLSEEQYQQLSVLIQEGQLPDFTFPLSIQSIRPKNYIMQIDAITNHLPVLKDQKDIKVGSRGNQPIKTAVTLDLPEHMKIEGGAILSTYDKSILNGVTSLLESGNAVFSIPMLYHAMTGKQNPTVDESLSEEICGKLEKMRRMMISIDLTEESRARYITDENGDPLDIENLTIEGYLLPLNKITGVINGKKTELFQLIQTPPLYSYSKLRRQLASVPIQLLNAPLNNNSTTIPLKTYLLQRIELMKNKKNNIHSHTILFDSIYEELGDQDAGKTRKMRIRTYTTTILDYLQQNGYISGYEIFKKGHAIAGVHIQFSADQMAGPAVH